MIDIHGHKKYKRDPKSFAVINVDKNEYQQNRLRQQVISKLTYDVNQLRQEMKEIKILLQEKINVGTTTS